MNSLTVNLNLLLTSFYTPTQERHKILLEESTFPTNYFACESHINNHKKYLVNESLFLLRPGQDELFHTKDILNIIEMEGDSIALVMLSGVQYLTGQLLDMEVITKAAHKKGCKVGFDLAQAIGAVELSLHDWEVDFAVWGNFKFMNCGPGAIGGAFMHRKHVHNNFPKLLVTLKYCCYNFHHTESR
uniref:Kynureninase n=1 Tax=Ciona savignyi TaxID=51511 RepID=H2Z0M2_CIOSA